jgi:hypothetical protein
VGWTGGLHNQSGAEGVEFVVDVTNCDDECRNCRFEGPSADPTLNILRRCLSDPSVACTADEDCPAAVCSGLTRCIDGSPCTPGGACPIDGQCVNFASASSISPVLSAPSCFATVFTANATQAAVEGRIDLQTGAVNFDHFGLKVASSAAYGRALCPTCEGDPTPNDGIAEGTCTLSPNYEAVEVLDNPDTPANEATTTAVPKRGVACDANGTSGVRVRAGTYSLDCAPRLTPTIDLTPVDFGTSSAPRWTIDPAEQPACGDGEACWCGYCASTVVLQSLDPSAFRACHRQTDCDAGDTCVTTGLDADNDPTNGFSFMAPASSNFCRTDSPCTWDPVALRGTCLSRRNDAAGNPVPTLCVPSRAQGDDVELRLRGESERLSDTSFTISAAGLGCSTPSAIPSTNLQLGLPGINITVLRYRVDLE